MLAAMGIRLWAPAPAVEPPRGVPPPPESGRVAEVAVAHAAGLGEAAAAPVAAPHPAAPARPVSAPPARPAPPSSRAANAPARAPEAAPATPAPSDAELAARAAAIATLAWTPLRDAVAACTACGLCESRRQTVFGVGHPQAEWMIVGEAPGEQEDLAGEPFVGPAGQLLDQMLRALGLSRLDEPASGRELRAGAVGLGDRAVDAEGDPARRVFIANTLKCRPPRNRNPEPDELARCEPFLRRQVELVRPRVILLMGRFAVKTLLKSDEAIGRLRGRLHGYEGIPVIVTYHPAYLLRNLPDKAKAWEDLCFAAATMAGLRAGGSGGWTPT
jgi:DNA polymerase